MPQPITKIVPNPYIKVDSNVLVKLPELAILVANIFAQWASIERDLAVLLIKLLGADAAPAHAIFSILQKQALQSKALEAAAKSILPPDQYDVFSAAMTVVEGAQKTRNKLAHWTWASCKERPLLLLLGDPKAMKDRDRRVASYFQKKKPGEVPDIDELSKTVQFDNDAFLAFSKEDLEREVRDLREAFSIVSCLGTYLDPSFAAHHAKAFELPEDPVQLRPLLLEKLSEHRLFREALTQIGAKKNIPDGAK